MRSCKRMDQPLRIFPWKNSKQGSKETSTFLPLLCLCNAFLCFFYVITCQNNNAQFAIVTYHIVDINAFMVIQLQ